MLPYVLVAGLVGLIAIFSPMRRVNTGPWSVAFVVLVLFVGLRHHVGMDWNNYLAMIYRATGGGIAQATAFAEPSYAALLWIFGRMGTGIYGPNLVVAVILMAGLFHYARTTPSPWVALLAALPFLVIVTGMSANRQTAAIGILLWTIADWPRYSVVRRTAMVGLAATFHASAIIFLALVLADLKIGRALKIAVVALGGAFTVYYLTLADRFDYYDQVYVSGQTALTQSSGAIFHVLLNAGPAIAYFAMRRYRNVLLPNDLHRNMAKIAIVLLLLAPLTSAAAGRASLYLFPVSMHIFAAFPLVLRSEPTRLMYRIGCFAFFMFTLVFWLLASNTGFSYLPYENFFTVDPGKRQLCC